VPLVQLLAAAAAAAVETIRLDSRSVVVLLPFLFSFLLFVVVFVLVVRRAVGILLTSFLLDAVITPTAGPSALTRTLDPVARGGREIVRISVAEFI
jgi:hypothetical protein